MISFNYSTIGLLQYIIYTLKRQQIIYASTMLKALKSMSIVVFMGRLVSGKLFGTVHGLESLSRRIAALIIQLHLN